MAISEEDRLWIEEKKRKFEREERELKRRGIIPYTEEELEEINAKKAEMREQAELNAEAMKKAGIGRRQQNNSVFDDNQGGAIGIDVFENGTAYLKI